MAESSSELEGKGAPVGRSDWALIGGHRGTMGKQTPKLIRLEEARNELSTVGPMVAVDDERVSVGL